jgi:hypothetical protein
MRSVVGRAIFERGLANSPTTPQLLFTLQASMLEKNVGYPHYIYNLMSIMLLNRNRL